MWERIGKHEVNDDANEPERPGWCPDWAPSQTTLNYVSSGLTGLLLILVTGYLVFHFAKGRPASHGATVAAGVGVGGAGT
jgi:hypothetical protein